MAYQPWQEELLKRIDSNIEMFSRYQSAHNVARANELKAGRAAAVESFKGRLDWHDVPWCVAELRMNMPAWGTYGT